MHHPCLTRSLVAGVASAGLLIGGCGDSESPPDRSDGATQSVASYREQATPLCRQASHAMSQATPPSSFPADLEEYDSGSRAMLEAIEGPYARLAALAAPEGMADDHRRLAAALRSAIADARQLRRLVRERNDDTDALALARTNVVTHTGNAMDVAAALGLSACTDLTFKES